MAAGLGVGLGHLLAMEDGTATEEDQTFYRTWLSRIEGWSDGERHLRLRAASTRPPVQMMIGQCLAETAIGGQGKTSDS
jgi:hypothetical protein